MITRMIRKITATVQRCNVEDLGSQASATGRGRRAPRWWARQATKLRGFGVPARGNAFIPCRAIQVERGVVALPGDDLWEVARIFRMESFLRFQSAC